MKTILSLSLALLFGTALCYSQNKTPLVGTWKLVSGKMMSGDSTFPYDMKTLGSIKIVTPTHFAVIAQNIPDSSFQHAVAGTVQMDDKNYSEQITYSSTKGMIGTTAKFTYTVSGDKWVNKGGIANVMMFEEEWQRVK